MGGGINFLEMNLKLESLDSSGRIHPYIVCDFETFKPSTCASLLLRIQIRNSILMYKKQVHKTYII